MLAHHCTEATLTENAVDYWLAARRQAWARSAAEETVALLRRGPALVPALPDGEKRRECDTPTPPSVTIGSGRRNPQKMGWRSGRARRGRLGAAVGGAGKHRPILLVVLRDPAHQ
jgi:hypothetical protein